MTAEICDSESRRVQLEHGGDIYGNQNIELDFSVNLSPAGPPAAVSGEICSGDLQRILASYPDPLCRELVAALSQRLAIPGEWILCGNGASELLMAAAQAVRPGKAMIPVPTYQGYERVLKAVGAQILFYETDREDGFLLTKEFTESDRGLRRLTAAESKTGSAAMLFLCNPNNPVGNCIDPEVLNAIAKYCRENQIFLMLDECYLDLLADAERRTMRHALAGNPYLILVNAFTKTYAMPGARLGYLMTSNLELLGKIQMQQPEWSVSMFAQKAGISALGAQEYLSEARQAVCAERNYVCGMLRSFGAKVFDGEAPFVLFACDRELYDPLKERGILIRRCDGIRGVRDPSEAGVYYYRIGLKSHEENVQLMNCIREILGL